MKHIKNPHKALKGKTIQKITSPATNVLTIEFTDGYRISVETEVIYTSPSMAFNNPPKIYKLDKGEV